MQEALNVNNKGATHMQFENNYALHLRYSYWEKVCHKYCFFYCEKKIEYHFEIQ